MSNMNINIIHIDFNKIIKLILYNMIYFIFKANKNIEFCQKI